MKARVFSQILLLAWSLFVLYHYFRLVILPALHE